MGERGECLLMMVGGVSAVVCAQAGANTFHMQLELSLLIYNTDCKTGLGKNLWKWLLLTKFLKDYPFWHYSTAYLATKTAPPRMPKTPSPTMHPAASYHQEGQPVTASELSSSRSPGHHQAAHRRGHHQLSHRRSP